MNVYSMIAYITGSFLLCTAAFSSDRFNIIVKAKWRDLECDNKKNIDFGGRWMLVGSITFKKQCKDPLSITAISLHWNGQAIDNLVASLYKKSFSKEFLPIEKNLICDGTWNKAKQSLIFNFDEKETLLPTTTFYLVLTIPAELEDILTNGTFSLEEHYLPKPFKKCVQATTQLSLGINNTPTLSTTT